MHRDDAGSATATATIMREAEINLVMKHREPKLKDLQISHQTGAQSIALPCQTMELMPRFKQASAVQNINRHVPEFHA